MVLWSQEVSTISAKASLEVFWNVFIGDGWTNNTNVSCQFQWGNMHSTRDLEVDHLIGVQLEWVFYDSQRQWKIWHLDSLRLFFGVINRFTCAANFNYCLTDCVQGKKQRGRIRCHADIMQGWAEKSWGGVLLWERPLGDLNNGAK